MTTLNMVREFHRVFVEEAGIDPEKIKACRVTLLKQELKELEEAISANNSVAILDALLDLQYVLDGTFIVYGFADVKLDGFSEVHRSNMSKLGSDGKPLIREDGKVIKGPNYSPPDLRGFVRS